MFLEYYSCGRGIKKTVMFINPVSGLADVQLVFKGKKSIAYKWTPDYYEGIIGENDPEPSVLGGSYKPLHGAAAESLLCKMWKLVEKQKEAEARQENTNY